MDVGASFQFLIDAFEADFFAAHRFVALDWRGYGLTQFPDVDSYWMADYLGDLDAVVRHLAPDGAPLDLIGHSMGGNVVMLWAGVRPERVRRLVNLEGFGMPRTQPEQAPKRYAQWLDALQAGASMKPYPSLDAVAERLMKTNPRLEPGRARWLARHWSVLGDDGQYHVRGDPAHKIVNAHLYQVDEVLACWKRIRAPLLCIEGTEHDFAAWWGQRYSLAEYHERLRVVPDCRIEVLPGAGHMLHHEQPDALARLLEGFLA